MALQLESYGMTTQAAPAPHPHKKSVAREYLESIVVAVILALFIRTFAVQAFKIPTGSMEYNLLIGDHLLVNKLVYSPSFGPIEDTILGKKPIRRGDVVVFKFPEDPTRDFIKRVIALPGETVEIRNKQVLINGKPLPEDEQVCTKEQEASCTDADAAQGGPYKVYYREAPVRPGDPEYGLRGDSIRDNWGPREVPDGQLLVLGDNRDNSRDSRFWGFLPRDQVKGRALLVYWSYAATGEEYRREGAWERVKDTLSAFSRTRWKRFFHVIR
jgi:signal peptidase I